MRKRGRSFFAAFLGCAILLVFAGPAYAPDNEAGRTYAVACQRFSELKRSHTKKKYRTYWLDCIRTFELIEKKYSDSPSAADACFARGAAYHELFEFNKRQDDADTAIQASARCQSSYPKHSKAPEALFRIAVLTFEHKKDRSSAAKTYEKLALLYPDSIWTDKARGRLGLNSPEHGESIGKRPAPSNAGPQGAVTGVRYWSGGAYTRIVIDMDRQLSYRTSELKNPDRLFFDIEKARLSGSLRQEPLQINDGILKQVRLSQHDADTVRVVLDLASLKNYRAFPLKSHDRLVIDINGDPSGPASRPADSEIGTEPRDDRQKDQPQPPKDDDNSGKDKFSLSEQYGLKIKTIAIDAGHGGHDPGAIGKRGLKEKEITLDIAKRLAALVKERLRCNVVMTRDRDVFVDLDARPAIAMTKKADLFVSIHINANRKRKARGIETYIQGLQASDRDSMATAARENAMTSRKLSELEDILKGLAMGSNDDDSIELAHAVQTSLVVNVKPVQPHVVNLGVKRAFFYVLINTEMPSILAECGFISNPDEEKLLRRPEYRQRLAEALFQGIKKYVENRSQLVAGI